MQVMTLGKVALAAEHEVALDEEVDALANDHCNHSFAPDPPAPAQCRRSRSLWLPAPDQP